MHGNLDPEERVLDAASLQSKIAHVVNELKWEPTDDIEVSVGGQSTYMIDGPGTRWSPLKGSIKYNKDAFIVIKNNTRNPRPERLADVVHDC